eukprot:TRINITY_DN12789_c0_g1_i1.p1 TRINITY_DN12789_c0_g1~~TRINITY_DN12789_c0_g1_i1.p1  ORF type:complete len:302 (+),score=73.85 TRINITY_DN12789_c0_g1_i1:45-950(+)
MSTGSDTEGRSYTNIDEMWEHELALPQGKKAAKKAKAKARAEGKDVPAWYTKAVDYWMSVPATDDGMLGGLSQISDTDVKTSTSFLRYFLDGKYEGRHPSHMRALDCGAGIGRVTRLLLLPLFEEVDLLEQNPNFIAQARVELAPHIIAQHTAYAPSDTHTTSEPDTSATPSPTPSDASPSPSPSPVHHVADLYCCGMQDFIFSKQYDVIWIQWVIGHLTDVDLINFMGRCQRSLRPGGIVCIKDNYCRREFVVDKQDSSVTRTDEHFRTLFEQAGVKVLKALVQPLFPKELFPVMIYALA